MFGLCVKIFSPVGKWPSKSRRTPRLLHDDDEPVQSHMTGAYILLLPAIDVLLVLQKKELSAKKSMVTEVKVEVSADL